MYLKRMTAVFEHEGIEQEFPLESAAGAKLTRAALAAFKHFYGAEYQKHLLDDWRPNG